MRPTATLLGLNKHLRSTLKSRLRQAIKRTGVEEIGRHTKHGRYIIEYEKVRTYVPPANFENFRLTPFVTNKILPGVKSETEKKMKGPEYLKKWKAENGED